jgi:YjbE family integral membrane protein
MIEPRVIAAMPEFLAPYIVWSPQFFAALAQVIMIDLVLAGDNAVIIGLAAAGLAPAQRSRAILVGIIAATVLRILFAGIAVELLDIVGLLLAGGILLLWVCWKMWRELRAAPHAEIALNGANAPRKSFAQAAWQIVVADISMSLDNVLAVAGAAREHPAALVFGLGLSIVMMGVAASFIARLLQKQRWIAYVGLAIILYVAGDMIWRGALEVWPNLLG